MDGNSPKGRFAAAAALLALPAGLAFGTAGAVPPEAKLTASDAVSGDHLGVSPAAAGDTVVVGTAERNADQGAVYVSRRTGTTWAEEALLTPSGAADAHFGTSAAIDGDTIALTLGFAGDVVVPGAAEDLTIAFGDAYSATLSGGWVRKGATWTRKAKAPGVTKAVVDHARGTITLAGSGLDLGTFDEGATRSP